MDPARFDQFKNIEEELDYDFSVHEKFIRSDEEFKELLLDPFLMKTDIFSTVVNELSV